ncbi:MAG: aminopeptidase [ANME-2 cluster archaeon]|nr:aminopeptidase [ANME-2 cluster archaeon]MBC2702611.1 aminopeptidase [ANME-2 cluster archaeon]MBC2708124.1 aminopeptidase [ANME-2 cluster archaeon]MBC2745572.1 aminopeptidase [ANME-2 cluster archaeon]
MSLKNSTCTVLETCMAVKPEEVVLIITDTATHPSIASALYDRALELGCDPIFMNIEPREVHGQEPPPAVAEAMAAADVVLAPTSKSLTHTQAKINAKMAGVRIATMPGISLEMMESGGISADYLSVKDTAFELKSRLDSVNEVRITTDIGTDIVFNVKGCEWMVDHGICHEPGYSTNLPAGEVFVAPKSGNGVFVVDGSMSGLGILNSPLTIKIEDGQATDITGESSGKLIEMIDSVGPPGRNLAELGIGINPEAHLIGNVLEDEKVAGTVHVALGDNSAFGGDVVAGIHLDGIITGPTVYLDGEPMQLPI